MNNLQEQTTLQLEKPFRMARIADCYRIAELFSMASDGVSNYIWTRLMPEFPGLTLLEIGAKRYASETSVFGYKNCIVAEHDREAIGMMLTYPILDNQQTENSDPTVDLPADRTAEPDVLAPYNLEAPGTWYICALAVMSEFRNLGLGSQFLLIARRQAQQQGFQELSLLCFEQNVGALRLYKRHGFKVIARTPVVPHPLIHHTGDLLLMTAPV